MPRKIRPKNVPISTMTVWALRASGGLNAGTPLDTASVPVRATEPDENARRMSSKPERLGRLGVRPGGRRLVGGHRPGHEAEEAEPEHAEDRDQVDVRRDAEDEPALADAAQVDHGDEQR